ncbi:MtrAB system histidine kinase MtrB [Nakamurella endophytica]|uniref:Sensor histidine kinase MtrB n=1 Tax=Nakamurella endophytica TaxID=1748367 RepID=A0A917SJW7_9ACTN|nr:MtrAB system histidine kinase MtrB [Nakamurella endophytica]GGL86015.1 putative sensor histidine kinase MtrB [Nakamurella endophytica]
MTSVRALRHRLGLLRWRLSFIGRSLLLRAAVVTLIFSTLAMVGIGFILQSQITNRLLDSKRSAAVAEVAKAAATVDARMTGVDSDLSSVREALQRTLDELANPARSSSTGNQGAAAGSFDPVIAPSRSGPEDVLAVGPIADVPSSLRARVGEGYVATEYTRVVRDGVSVPALVAGSPATATTTEAFVVYLIFPLTFEQSTVAVVQNTLLVGGAGLVLVLTVIAVVVAAAVVRPVRRAAAVAGRLAAGDLAERMPVRGPVELTTLARSFNGMADAIRAQIRQLEEFGKLQRRFTSDVSHELRTPVTTVRMAADFLHGSRDELPPHLARSTELLVAELDRFESLLADLLEISRHDAGMAELAAEEIDVRGIVTAAVRATDAVAARAGVEITVALPDRPVLAQVDHRRVTRILRNLLNNAVDHAERGLVEVEMAADDQALAITVTDHGVGLKPGEAGLVFNRFWRADPSRQRHTGGTGLGLSIALEDARLHGGWLQASGQPGVGARFRLTLPLRQGQLVDSSPLPLRRPGDEPAELEAGSGSAVPGGPDALPLILPETLDPAATVGGESR